MGFVMPTNKTPKQIKLTAQDISDLTQRIKDNALSDEDINTLLELIAFNAWLQDRLSHANLSIKNLRKIFGFTSESINTGKKNNKENKDPNTENNNNDTANDNKADSNNSASSDNKSDEEHKTTTNVKWDKNQNHGRTAASAYTGCPTIEVDFTDDALTSGFCSCCAQSGDRAKLEYADPSVLVFLEGTPLVSGNRVSLKRAKCSVCESYFTADTPDEFKGRSKNSHTVSSAIAIQHYISGQPFKRIEGLQKAQGVPLADATQYDLMKVLYNTAVKSVVGALETCASNGSTHYFDDTNGRVIDQIVMNKRSTSSKDKKAIHATALLSEYDGHRIYLFQTDTKTAGQTFASIIENRQSSDDFITMSDASANNFPQLEESLLAKWLIALCLAHSRRKFHELIDDKGGDEDCRLVLAIIGNVYANERHCKDANLNDEDRLVYHQQHSAPEMVALRTWLNNLLLHKQVEPNSPMGEAIAYLLKRWKFFTQFQRLLGAPLDNNICEIAIKVLIRYRNNSRFYKTLYGASIGDAMMSVLHTAIAAGINPFDYLNTLQLYSDDVQTNPDQWLPWNYQDTLYNLTISKAA